MRLVVGYNGKAHPTKGVFAEILYEALMVQGWAATKYVADCHIMWRAIMICN